MDNSVSYYLPLDGDQQYLLPTMNASNNPKPYIIVVPLNPRINNLCFLCYKEAIENFQKFFLLTCNPNNPKNYIKTFSPIENQNNILIKITKILNSEEIYFHKNCFKNANISSKHINENYKVSQLNILHIISNKKIPKIEITFSPSKLKFSFNHLNALDVVLEHLKKGKNNNPKISSIVSQIIDPDVKQHLHISSNKNILKKFNLLPDENSSINVDDIFEMLSDNTFSSKIFHV